MVACANYVEKYKHITFTSIGKYMISGYGSIECQFKDFAPSI